MQASVFVSSRGFRKVCVVANRSFAFFQCVQLRLHTFFVFGGIQTEAEYNTLRNEILSLMQKRDEYTRFAYTVMAAIWTAAFAIGNAYIVMLECWF